MISLRNFINSKQIPQNQNPQKVADIVEKNRDFGKQQKGEGLPLGSSHVAKVSLRKVSDSMQLKITNRMQLKASPKPVKVGSTSENVLNEIRQVIYSLNRAKRITKKLSNNIMNSIKL